MASRENGGHVFLWLQFVAGLRRFTIVTLSGVETSLREVSTQSKNAGVGSVHPEVWSL
jgi:hypothetical protein